MDNGSQTVVITGATRGLGKELSLAFGAEGYYVIGLFHSDLNAAADLEAEFASKGLSGSFIRQDIAADGPWPEFDALISSSRDRVFTLISNASASFVPKPLHLIRQRELDELLRVSVSGTLNVLNRLLPLMGGARSGLVVSILSSAMRDRPKGFAAYLAAKSAQQSLLQSAAAEYGRRGVKFVCVSPGFMETPLTAGWSAHLKASMNVRPLDPAHVASRILEISNDPSVAGQGENYQIDLDPRSAANTAS